MNNILEGATFAFTFIGILTVTFLIIIALDPDRHW